MHVYFSTIVDIRRDGFEAMGNRKSTRDAEKKARLVKYRTLITGTRESLESGVRLRCSEIRICEMRTYSRAVEWPFRALAFLRVHR